MSQTREPVRFLQRLGMSRRELLKAAPVAGAGAAVLGLGRAGKERLSKRRTHGLCRFCLIHCGVTATTEGERLVRVEGDIASKTRGFLCLHGHAMPEVVHSDRRVRMPLAREGDTFREVGWDEALARIAERLERVKAEFGPEALLVQTGWPLVRHPLVGLLHRFCQAFGTPNLATVGSFCETAGRMGKALTLGSKYSPNFQHVRTLVLWGANPTHALPIVTHLVTEKATSGKLVVVDPVRTELAALATEHLSVRPGTDGALALGMMHVIIAERLYDPDFIDSQTVGFDELKALAAQYPPEAVAGLTTVPRDQIVRVERLVAREVPTSVWEGLGIEHHENGVQTVRAVAVLEALCRRSGQPEVNELLTPVGANFYDEPLPALLRPATAEPVPPPVRARPLGYASYPLFETFNREAHGALLAEAVLNDDPYPVRALLVVAARTPSSPPRARSGCARQRPGLRFSSPSTRSSPPPRTFPTSSCQLARLQRPPLSMRVTRRSPRGAWSRRSTRPGRIGKLSSSSHASSASAATSPGSPSERRCRRLGGHTDSTPNTSPTPIRPCKKGRRRDSVPSLGSWSWRRLCSAAMASTRSRDGNLRQKSPTLTIPWCW